MPLRVIGGALGGRGLKGPPRTGVRPTQDRVREALFEILTARDAPMRRVLDLYSGTGALGIEALSRGAEYCDFVESDTKACDVIRENLFRTGLLDCTKLWPMAVSKALARLDAAGRVVKAGEHLPAPAEGPHTGAEAAGDTPDAASGMRPGAYDLVLADPPYEYDRAEAELTEVLVRGLLAPGGTLVVEHSQRKVWPQTLGGLKQLTSRRYGDTRITFYG
jgi:16S rRNA (guanine966-N2)-methyltransferase